MHQYVARRLLLFVASLLGASILIFVLLRLVPGDAGSASSSSRSEEIDLAGLSQ
jgi:peptide/nickel transport system permease protein